MASNSDVIDEMMRGFDRVAVKAEGLDLSFTQRALVRQAAWLIRRFRPVRPVVRARHMREVDAKLADRTGLKLRARPGKVRGRTDGFYLNDAEIAEFESTGVFGPFDVLPEADAKKLAALAFELSKADFAKNTLLTQEIVKDFQSRDSFGINLSGRYQALRVPEFFDLCRRPEIAHRIASLLGEDVLVWRSEFFEKQPGYKGTFWHQNGDFRELAARPKLLPPPGIDVGMIQLTAWVALTDVDLDQAPMRILLGSCDDARCEFMYNYARDRSADFFAQVPDAILESVLKMAMFGPNNFAKAQAIFEGIVGQLDGIFAGKKIRDYPMKAGQAIIFSSLDIHASYDYTRKDGNRLAFGGRYIGGDTAAYKDLTWDAIGSPSGRDLRFPVDRLPNIHVHGATTSSINRITTKPITLPL